MDGLWRHAEDSPLIQYVYTIASCMNSDGSHREENFRQYWEAFVTDREARRSPADGAGDVNLEGLEMQIAAAAAS